MTSLRASEKHQRSTLLASLKISRPGLDHETMVEAGIEREIVRSPAIAEHARLPSL
jgi:hypothetical protein